MKDLSAFTLILLMFAISLNAQDMFEARQLTSDRAQEGFPTWSPDGKFIIYQHTDLRDTTGKNGLWKISIDGSGAEKVFSGIAEHAQWSPNGRFIVFDADTGNSIKMIPAEGGEPIEFLPDTIDITHGGLPYWSPDGSKIAFKDSDYFLCIYDVNSKQTSRVFKQEGLLLIPGCWSADGKYVFAALMDRATRRSTMWKISTDGKEKKQIQGQLDNFYRYIAVSPDGSLLIYAAKEDKYLGLFIMPAEGGKSLPLAGTQYGHNEAASWSPDGKKLIFARNFDIWLMDINNEEVKKKLQALNN